ncbi:Bug family tripartite tricarboxylate transporter substrate binding protein [Paracoccus sp. NGMCC 1.201697]|uniref:Bug family tripartite tricarboxylate transporter substrate binding protein n=1 Tax=Paracoccus broussonetiae subsp. drimophilus TaxID=3373869 RepID=A0ABW7LR26_9RHOB
MMKKAIGASVASLMLLSVPAWAEWSPDRPVEFVVASGAGGGSDNFARTIQSVLTRNKLIDKPIVVLNKGGGSGAEAFLYGKQNKADPSKLIFATNNAYLLPHVAKLAYSVSDLQPVAALAMDEFIVWVKANAPYKTITDLTDAAKAEPGKIVFGGSQSKDVDETLVALIEDAAGVDFKYVPFNGGGEASVQLAGGHITANTNNPNENIGQWQAGAIRPLCVVSAQRMAKSEPIQGEMGWQDIPTCKEQGLNIDSYQMPRTVWMPAETPPEAVAFYQQALKAVFDSPEWQDYLTKTSQTGTFLTGDDLKSFVNDSETKTVAVFKEQGWSTE